MGNVILHISDLHVSTKVDNGGIVNTKIDSYLTTDNDEASTHYISEFIDKARTEFSGETLSLLITGDISDTGDKQQFDKAENLLKKIMTDLEIPPERVLLLPGDHDVHRRSLENETDLRPNKDSHLLNSVKFKHFGEFYQRIKNKNFPFDEVIIDYLVVDTVVLIGFNSNYKINAKGGLGFIPIEKFNQEVTKLKGQIGLYEKHWVACWHHNLTAGFENTNNGQWDSDNRKYLLSEIERQNIKLILTGNEHISDAKTVRTIYTSDSGSFTTMKWDTTFKAYPISTKNKISLVNKLFALAKPNGNDQGFFWDIRSNIGAKQPDEFELFKDNNQVISSVLELPNSNNEQQEIPDEVAERVEAKPLIRYKNESVSDKLYSLVREKKLFHTGHFHWSESSRAHNWIDISKLLENSKDLYFIQNAIIDIIDTFHLEKDCKLLIGLGYEGNIISSKASIKYNIPYTSLPYSYRYSDHHDYEKKLNYSNDDGAYKTVMIVTDVVNDGRTLRKLMKEHENSFFDKVEKTIVLSLLYTGHDELSTETLNNIQSSSKADSDYIVSNIEFYSIMQLRVEKCPFGENYKDECLIYKDQLSCVHLFYDENSQ